MMAKVPPKPSSKGVPPAPTGIVGNLDKPEPEELVALNFKVPAPFRKEFKIAAAELDVDMVDLLRLSFAAFKRERAK
jgi:hypothetical protein